MCATVLDYRSIGQARRFKNLVQQKKKKRKFSDQKVDLFNIRFSNNVFLPNVYVSRLCDCYSIRLLSDHLICSREYVLESMFDNNV